MTDVKSCGLKTLPLWRIRTNKSVFGSHELRLDYRTQNCLFSTTHPGQEHNPLVKARYNTHFVVTAHIYCLGYNWIKPKHTFHKLGKFYIKQSPRCLQDIIKYMYFSRCKLNATLRCIKCHSSGIHQSINGKKLRS